jgi:hypothetical protein
MARVAFAAPKFGVSTGLDAVADELGRDRQDQRGQPGMAAIPGGFSRSAELVAVTSRRELDEQRGRAEHTEQAEPHLVVRGPPRKMHPDDAGERGVENGKYVRVFNERRIRGPCTTPRGLHEIESRRHRQLPRNRRRK